jgi:diaminopimelate decarboxylase
LRTEILLISRKSSHERERWIFLDAGIYNGLDETLNERIHYRIRTQNKLRIFYTDRRASALLRATQLDRVTKALNVK